MVKKADKNYADFIMPLYINGLQGRVLIAPPIKEKSSEILVIYDQHSSLERWEILINELRRYGRVAMPDLPGFGGMNSFFKINKEPNIDNLAGYLASFIKLRYKRKNIVIIGIGFGFVLVTRMLELYPDLTNKVSTLIALDGFAHHGDYSRRMRQQKLSSGFKKFQSTKLLSLFYRNVFLYPAVLRLNSQKIIRIGSSNYKFPRYDKSARDEIIRRNIKLWRVNDVRTFMFTSRELLSLNNCTKTINLKLYNVISGKQSRFDRFKTDQHLKVIYKKVTTVVNESLNYDNVGVLPIENSSLLLPPRIKKLLSSLT